MASRWTAPTSVVEKRSRSFLQTLLDKDQVERARAFCARDEIPDDLRVELLATIDAHEQKKKDASDQLAAEQAAAAQAKQAEEEARAAERRAQMELDKQRYGELRSLLERAELAQANKLVEQISTPDLVASAREAIAQREIEHRAVLAERYKGQDFVAIEGGALVANANSDALYNRLRASRDWGGSPRRSLHVMRAFDSNDGASQAILDDPRRIGAVAEGFGWEGRDRYSWWKPDWSPNERESYLDEIAQEVGTFTASTSLEGFLDYVSEQEDFAGGLCPADFEHLTRWLASGGEPPELTDEWEWDDGEVQGWQDLLQRMKRYADVLADIDAFTRDYFFGEEPDARVVSLNLLPDENENDAWVYEALVSEKGVIMIGYFYEL